MNNQRSLFFNVDWIVILLFLILCLIGWFNIHSAVFNPEKPNISFNLNDGRQLGIIISAIMIGFLILLIDSKFFNVFSPIFYGITIILLIVVLVVGRNVGGNQAWIPLGSFRLQPSEFAKFATCLLLARFLSGTNVKATDWSTLLICAGIIGLPMFLIILQPDAGSTLVFFSLIFVLYREGFSPYYLIAAAISIALFILTLLVSQFYLVALILAVSGYLIYRNKRNRDMIVTTVIGCIISIIFVFSVNFLYQNVLKPHQKVRIDEWLGITTDLRGIGYNVNQSKIAIGSGGLTGRGYLQGTQTKYDFVPEQSTDFIFCTIGEEWGFVGSVTVIGLYLFLLLRIINIAERQRSSFSRIYGYGVASIIFFHFFINIGMTIGLIPVIGIPLPLLSYGGSSLWSFTILIFILLKFDSNRMGII